MKADCKRCDFSWRLKADCKSTEFQVDSTETENVRKEKLLVIADDLASRFVLEERNDVDGR